MQLHRILLLAFLAAQSEAKPEESQEAKAKEPLVHTDILHGTADLLYGIYDATLGKLVSQHVAKHGETVRKAVSDALPKDPITDVCAKVGCEAKDVREAYDTAKAKAGEVRETAMNKVSQIHEPLNKWSDFVANTFEDALPNHKGRIPRTPGSLTLFIAYLSFVLYVLFNVASYIIRLKLSIFCFVCCCGCCRRKKVADQKQDKNGKANGSVAAQKGKAALAAAPKKKK